MKYLNRAGMAVFLLFVFSLICACGQGKGGYSSAAFEGQYAAAAPAMGSDSVQYNSAETALEDSAGGRGDEISPLRENTGLSRKLVKRAEIRLRVDNLGAMEKPLAGLIEKYGAWPASTGIYENSRHYSVRVPASSYDAMLSELAGMGRLIGRTENAEDVTLRYYDLEGRLATRQELLKTYQSYLGKAANIDEIMTVESKIADLQYEIDRTGTQFRNLANLVDYSTIDIEMVGPVSASPYAEPGLGEKLKELFGSFGDVVSSAAVVLTGIVIYGIPAVLVLILFFSIFFGRIGLLKKLWRFAAGKKSGGKKTEAALAREEPGQPSGAVPSAAKKPDGKKTERGLTQKEAQMLADGALTKDEIELLLSGGPIPSAGKNPDGRKPTEILTQEEINYILEAITKGENQTPPPWGKKPPAESKE